MMRVSKAWGLVCTGCLLASLPAQPQTTSPTGMENTAGNSEQSIFVTTSVFGGGIASQFAHIDATLVGNQQTIKALHLRQSVLDRPTEAVTPQTS